MEDWFSKDARGDDPTSAEFLAGTSHMVVARGQSVYVVDARGETTRLFTTPHGYITALDTTHDAWGRDVIAVAAGATLYIYWLD